MMKNEIREEDLQESFIRSSGPGGQNVNKVATCVVLVHRPTGISVKFQEGRTQAANRLKARELLLKKIVHMREQQRLAKKQAAELKKRQNRRRPKALKEKILEFKRKQAEKKSGRKKFLMKDL